jgi:DNA-binding NarL/FixJ family response regulator
MREPRAYRPALEPAHAAAALRTEAAAGRLDATVVEAVLAAAGQRAKVRKSRPAGLTDREVEVLALAAQGLPNKQIAARLTVSPRTVGSHLAHIYEKVGVTTRAGATLFALRHDLVETSAG